VQTCANHDEVGVPPWVVKVVCPDVGYTVCSNLWLLVGETNEKPWGLGVIPILWDKSMSPGRDTRIPRSTTDRLMLDPDIQHVEAIATDQFNIEAGFRTTSSLRIDALPQAIHTKNKIGQGISKF